MGALAEYAIYDGRITEALPMLRDSAHIYRELDEPHELAVNLCRFAHAAAAVGKAEAAARILSAAETLREEISVRWSYWVVEMNDATLREAHAALDDAAFREAWERGRKLSADDAIGLALATLDGDSA